MQEIVTALINVLIVSSMYIVVALGFAFLFNTLGILNLAHGAIYMIGSYICYFLIVDTGVNHWIALVLSALSVAAFGVFLERYCFRPFTGNFNRVVMVCVAITVVLQTSVNIIGGAETRAIPAFVNGVMRAGSVTVSYERIVTFSIGAALLVGITWFVRRTKQGQQMQAVAQNKVAAMLQGISVHRISGFACALGCGLAALAGCLMGAFTGLGPFMGDVMLVKVLVVVMLAGVGSFGGIFAGGLILGTLDVILPLLLHGAVSNAISVCVVVFLLLFRPSGFFGREVEDGSGNEGEDSLLRERNSLRSWTKVSTCAAFVLALCLLPLVFGSPYTVHILTLCFIYVIGSVSFRTITISGQLPLAHGAFMGIGAYLSGMASRWLGWPAWLTIPLAAIATTGVGVLIGWPFAKLRTLYYAMGSLFFGIGAMLIIAAGGRWTGGYAALSGIRPIFQDDVAYYYFFLGLAVVSCLALYRFEFCRIGTNLKAIAQSHTVASSVGINEARYRIAVVGFGCFFVGLAGAGYAHYSMVISPSSFSLVATLWLLMYVLVGGVRSFAGPVVGTFVLFLIPQFLGDLKMYSPFVSAAILLIVVYLMPGGLVSMSAIVGSWHWAHKRGVRSPSRQGRT
jgi:branched-chain amino acid transport system permease protein